MLHCSATVILDIEGSLRKNKTTGSYLSHIVTAPFTETAQGFLFQGEDEVERQDLETSVYRCLLSIAWES